MTTVHVVRSVKPDDPFHYLETLTRSSWRLFAYLRDETLARRPTLWWSTSSCSPISSPQNVQPKISKPEEDYVLRGTIPQSQLKDFIATFRAFEGFALLGLILCFQAMLYDVTVMPLKALVTICYLVKDLASTFFYGLPPLKWQARKVIQRVSDRLLALLSFWRHRSDGMVRRATENISPLQVRRVSKEISPDIKSEIIDAPALSPRLLSIDAGCLTKQTISSNDLTSLLDCLVLFCVFIVYRVFFHASSMYHFIRGQSLLKLYVVFNMLEIVERMWRSSERDVLDDLRLQADSLIFNTADLTSPRFVSPLISPYTSEVSPLIESKRPIWRWVRRDTRKLTSMSSLSGTDTDEFSAGIEWRNLLSRFWHNPWISLGRRFVLAVFYVAVHTAMHLGRGMLLCIAINAPESAMFLLLVTNNFGEIKSTVFKKQTPQTLWILAASDVCERFQIFTDILFVYLQTSRSPRAGAEAASNAFKWLGMMIALELFVDYSKHAFLIKFNKLHSTIFNKFRMVCMMDVLMARSPTAALDLSLNKISVPTPGQGMMAFVHISTRRLGFNTLPFLAFLICFAPSPLFSLAPLDLVATVACWLSLFLALMIINMAVLKFCIDRSDQVAKVDDELARLAPQ